MNNTIFCDVDGTLIDHAGNPNLDVISWLSRQKANGFEIYLWSMRGKDHAFRTAQRLEICNLFAGYLPKPNFVVDDHGWSWIRFCRSVSFDEISNKEDLTKL